MGPSIFDFAMGTKVYPKESRIARAKASAVGGKRKRCTKGKNCSAACIAANMVCLVDLPWVGSALTKAKAQIQAAKGKAPAAAKPAAAPTPAPAPAPAQQKPTWQKEQAVKNMPGTPAEQEKQLKFNLKVAKNKGTPEQIAEAQKQLKDFQDKQKAAAPKPTAATPKKKAIDKIPTVEVYKKWGVAQLEAGIENLKNSPNVNLESPTAKKAIGNMTEALKQLKAEQAAAAKPAAAPAPAPAKPKTPVKVETVEKYKSFGLPFLESALPIAEKGRKAQTPEGQQAIANIKKAISELKAQPANAAPTAVPAAPTAKPAAQGATQLPVKAGAKPLDPDKYDAKTFTQFYDDAKKLGLTSDQAKDFFFDWIGAKGMMSLAQQDIPTFIKDFNKAAGLSAFSPGSAKAATGATTLKPPAGYSGAYKKWDTDQLVKFQASLSNAPAKNKAAIDEIQFELDSRGYKKPTVQKVPYAQPGSKDNRQGLNEGQFKAWGPFFQPFTSQSLKDYDKVGDVYLSSSKFPKGTLENMQHTIVKNAHQTSAALTSVEKAKSESDLPDVAFVQKAAKNLGLDRLQKGVKGISNFTGTDYEWIRNAQRNRVPRDYDYLSDAEKAKRISEYKKKAEDMEAVLGYMPKPQVPKMRGVAVGNDELNKMIDLAKNKGSMQQLAMNSWSTNTRTPQQFADDGAANGYGNNLVIYRTLNKKGASIMELSGIQSENEILTPANTNYRFYDYHTVVGQGGKTFHIFDMVEY